MKYIIFQQEKTGLKMPVIFPDHVTHASVKIEGAHPVSAGFFKLKNVAIYKQPSESLKLSPKKGDRELLIFALMDAGMYAFMNL